ncbi:MAG: hypothetical protein D3926_11105 [Desulfobacteraceae bacterium]|nr:MAG: hypothetical protein D3926_11105 [Desulfobacteraceae bacterium]
MDTIRLDILRISIELNFAQETLSPLNSNLELFKPNTRNKTTPKLNINIVEKSFTGVDAKNHIKNRNRSIKLLRNGENLIFNYFTGQFLTDPDFSDVKIWSPYEKEISIERDGSINYNGDPTLRLILWGRASLEKYCYLHGALVVLEGKYILLMGDSGVGKTTLSKLSCECGGTCLTEEDPFISKIDNEIIAYGTPWPGIIGPPVPDSGKLHSIFFLEHAKQNELKRLTPPEASKLLLHNSRTFNWLPHTIPDAIDLLNITAQSIPSYRFGFTPDQSAVEKLLSVL